MKEYSLKPCPFCGGKARIGYFTETAGIAYAVTYKYSYVECIECGSKTHNVIVSAEHCSNDLAVKAWNKRVSDGNEEGREDG